MAVNLKITTTYYIYMVNSQASTKNKLTSIKNRYSYFLKHDFTYKINIIFNKENAPKLMK